MKPENPNHLFPLFITNQLVETKRFYTEVAGFTVTVDVPTYLQVASNGKGGPELCFMTPDAFSDGVARPPFPGQGVVISIPTPDADSKHLSLTRAGAKPDTEPSNKPWGGAVSWSGIPTAWCSTSSTSWNKNRCNPKRCVLALSV